MMPFILKFAEFDNENMIVIAHTSRGKYKFPVLPASKSKKEAYFTELKNERYVIFTKDYPKLKEGDFGEEEEIKLIHEVLHYDWRVITPYYSTAVWYSKILPTVDDELAPVIGNFFRLSNLCEDLSIYYILIKMGRNPSIVEKVNVSPRKIREFFEIFDLYGNNVASNVVSTLFSVLPTIIRKVFLPDGISFNFLDKCVELTPEIRIPTILLTYRIIDSAIPKILKKLGGNYPTPRKEDLIEIANVYIRNTTDPLHKMRWSWELESLKSLL